MTEKYTTVQTPQPLWGLEDPKAQGARVELAAEALTETPEQNTPVVILMLDQEEAAATMEGAEAQDTMRMLEADRDT